MTMSDNHVPQAIEILNSVRDIEFEDRPAYLHAYKLRSALLIYAPSESAKQEIAKDILKVDITADRDTISDLTSLTDYWWTTLLVPYNILSSHLMMKKCVLKGEFPNHPPTIHHARAIFSSAW